MSAHSIIAASLPIDDEAVAAPQVLIMVLGVVMLGVVIMISIRGKIARRQAETPSPRERLDRLKTGARAREGHHAAEASMLDIAQRLAGQLDAKAERLEQLIADADQRLAAFRAMESRSAPTPDDEFDEATPPSPVGSIGPTDHRADPVTEAVYRLADDGHDVRAIARELGEQTGKVELILALREGA